MVNDAWAQKMMKFCFYLFNKQKQISLNSISNSGERQAQKSSSMFDFNSY